MESIKILFEIAPLSQNNIERTGSRTSHRYKTDMAKDYKTSINTILRMNSSKLNRFFKCVDLDRHVLVVQFVWFINEHIYFKKKKTRKNPYPLSSRCVDYDNPIKYTQDCIFKHFGIDDTFIQTGQASKMPTKKQSYFTCRVATIEKDELFANY